MNLRQAAEMALEALEAMNPYPASKEDQRASAIATLRAALAEADEPVAWQCRTRPTWGRRHGLEERPWSPWEFCSKEVAEDCWRTPFLNDWAYEARALYTHPPRREPLTEEAICDLWSWASTHEAEQTATTQQHAFARAIERAHGIGGDE